MSTREFFADVMTVREKRPLNALGRPLPGKTCHRGSADIEVAFGNHQVTRCGIPLVTVPAPITVFHFPMRSYEQFSSKVAKGGAALERNQCLANNIGNTWRHLFCLWKAGSLQEYYWSAVRDEATLALDVKRGLLIFDDRLGRFFREHPNGPTEDYTLDYLANLPVKMGDYC
jgi:hypothetical protein